MQGAAKRAAPGWTPGEWASCAHLMLHWELLGCRRARLGPRGPAAPPGSGWGSAGWHRPSPRGPALCPAAPGAGAAAQWQEAGLHALSGARRSAPLPPAAMGTGPGVSGRRAAARPGPGMPSRDCESPCVGGRDRSSESQVGAWVGPGPVGAPDFVPQWAWGQGGRASCLGCASLEWDWAWGCPHSEMRRLED